MYTKIITILLGVFLSTSYSFADTTCTQHGRSFTCKDNVDPYRLYDGPSVSDYANKYRERRERREELEWRSEQRQQQRQRNLTIRPPWNR